jgi:hypothetical protein
MGYTLKLVELTSEKIDIFMSPYIFCTDEKQTMEYAKDYEIISINKILSYRLLSYELEKRKLFVTDEFNKIISNKATPLMITDFEMLFSPEYEIDVLKLFITANRKRKIAALWCGKYENEILVFSEPDFLDYQIYNINNYDITCLI